MKKSRTFFLAGVAVLVIGVGIWIGWASPFFGSSKAPEAAGIVFDDPRQIDAVQLIDHNGKEFNVERLQNRWSLIYFGFSNCPDLCPMALTQFTKLDEELGTEFASPIQYIFVSVDPDRDTPDQLGAYVEYFLPGLIGVTGNNVELSNFANQLAVGFKVHSEEGDNYPVDHSNAILLVNPAAEFQAVFTAPHKADRMAADFRAIEEWYLNSG
jgi:protein SCO1/2